MQVVLQEVGPDRTWWPPRVGEEESISAASAAAEAPGHAPETCPAIQHADLQLFNDFNDSAGISTMRTEEMNGI